MAIRLRDLIKTVRSCKTAAEERAAIAKECANIRTSFAADDSENRQRNVAKLLYIHMLGYPTHFGQMECLKLIVSPHYSDKRIGYLGLMLLLDERQEVLMLVTNSLKNDLNNPNQYIVGLALCALANIGSAGIARDCGPEVEKLLNSTNPYIRKKAALCAIRIVRKVPELTENFVPHVRNLLTERVHGVLITGVALAIELAEADFHNVENFRKQGLVPQLVRILKNLVLSGYAPEYDVGGITDPFLQVKILKLLRLLGSGDKEATDQMNDILAQVATNTENLRNVGNAILYECSQTIMSIESDPGLRLLAVNLLGRFLVNRDNNIRYVALNTLSKAVASDVQAVQRHRNVIQDCLKDQDVSIRRRALDLIYALANDSNIKSLVRDLINILLMAEDPEFKHDLTEKLCVVTEKYAPTKQWHVDTMLRVMSISGAHVPEDSRNTLVTLIEQSPELQAYAVKRMYLALSRDNIQQSLAQVATWTIGEYADLLAAGAASNGMEANPEEENVNVTVTEKNILDLLESVLRGSTTTEVTKMYVINALVKLTERFKGSPVNDVRRVLDAHAAHFNAELQQRSCEYRNILKLAVEKPQLRGILLERIPARENVVNSSSSSSMPVIAGSASGAVGAGSVAAAGGGGGGGGGGASLIDDLLGGAATVPVVAAAPHVIAGVGVPAPVAAKPKNLLEELFSGAPSAGTSTTPASLLTVQSTPAASTNIMELLATPTARPAVPSPIIGGAALFGSSGVSTGASFAPFVGFQKNGLVLTCTVSKPGDNPTVSNITVTIANSTAVPLTDFVFQASVPKYCTMEFTTPMSGKTVGANNSATITQQLRVTNTLHGQRAVMLRIRLMYKAGEQSVVETADISNFPAGV